MSKILKVKARQVFDSRGNPTIEAEVHVKNKSAKAICPSGASTGTYEAYEKRDTNNKRYLGKSVFSAINLINFCAKDSSVKFTFHLTALSLSLCLDISSKPKLLILPI